MEAGILSAAQSAVAFAHPFWATGFITMGFAIAARHTKEKRAPSPLDRNPREFLHQFVGRGPIQEAKEGLETGRVDAIPSLTRELRLEGAFKQRRAVDSFDLLLFTGCLASLLLSQSSIWMAAGTAMMAAYLPLRSKYEERVADNRRRAVNHLNGLEFPEVDAKPKQVRAQLLQLLDNELESPEINGVGLKRVEKLRKAIAVQIEAGTWGRIQQRHLQAMRDRIKIRLSS